MSYTQSEAPADVLTVSAASAPLVEDLFTMEKDESAYSQVNITRHHCIAVNISLVSSYYIQLDIIVLEQSLVSYWIIHHITNLNLHLCTDSLYLLTHFTCSLTLPAHSLYLLTLFTCSLSLPAHSLYLLTHFTCSLSFRLELG